jgi:hypothetical protein
MLANLPAPTEIGDKKVAFGFGRRNVLEGQAAVLTLAAVGRKRSQRTQKDRSGSDARKGSEVDGAGPLPKLNLRPRGRESTAARSGDGHITRPRGIDQRDLAEIGGTRGNEFGAAVPKGVELGKVHRRGVPAEAGKDSADDVMELITTGIWSGVLGFRPCTGLWSPKSKEIFEIAIVVAAFAPENFVSREPLI